MDVRILHIHDPAEWTLDFSGEVRLFSPEDDTELPLDLAAARAQMPAVVDGYLADIREALASAGVSHHRFAVDAPMHEALRTAAQRAGMTLSWTNPLALALGLLIVGPILAHLIRQTPVRGVPSVPCC